jgi:hypothetical protein
MAADQTQKPNVNIGKVRYNETAFIIDLGSGFYISGRLSLGGIRAFFEAAGNGHWGIGSAGCGGGFTGKYRVHQATG